MPKDPTKKPSQPRKDQEVQQPVSKKAKKKDAKDAHKGKDTTQQLEDRSDIEQPEDQVDDNVQGRRRSGRKKNTSSSNNLVAGPLSQDKPVDKGARKRAGTTSLDSTEAPQPKKPCGENEDRPCADDVNDLVSLDSSRLKKMLASERPAWSSSTGFANSDAKGKGKPRIPKPNVADTTNTTPVSVTIA
ncbi:hypothetical protein BJ165DRAFT_1531829 [Panaeolus papilionaceus]|nr:hypothetical protein BJ165DRAFT_1531829 [Panaeolus papilionaceus]